MSFLLPHGRMDTRPIFTHPSVDGHVRRFCVSAIANSAAVTTGLQIHLFEVSISFPSDLYPEAGSLGPTAGLFLIFEEVP